MKTTYEFHAPALTAGKQQTWERTNKWLLKLTSTLQKNKDTLDELERVLEAAEAQKTRWEKDAALSADIALKLTGTESQIARLTPQVNELRQTLGRDIANAIRQVNLIRSTELRDMLYGPFLSSLQAIIATALAPFFPQDLAKHVAGQIMERTEPYRQISFYLNPPPLSPVMEFQDAKQEINALAATVTKILAGETVLEFCV